jgi:Predicted integral membrane protein
MLRNAELKREAKAMLKGRWKDSVLMCLVPTIIAILLAAIILIPVIILFQESITSLSDPYASDMSGGSSGGSGGIISGILSTFFALGISWTFLDIFRGEKVVITPFKDVFRGFRAPYALAIIVVYLLQAIFTFLWTLLFIIPGIVKTYSYSQAYNIYYDTYKQTGEKPSYLNVITASRKLMNGHKGQLFLLDLSFLGWHILAILTLGIGYLWLTPYISATKAAFYNHLPK